MRQQQVSHGLAGRHATLALGAVAALPLHVDLAAADADQRRCVEPPEQVAVEALDERVDLRSRGAHLARGGDLAVRLARVAAPHQLRRLCQGLQRWDDRDVVSLCLGDQFAAVVGGKRARIGTRRERGKREKVVAFDHERVHLELGQPADLLAEVVLVYNPPIAFLPTLDVQPTRLELGKVDDGHGWQAALLGANARQLPQGLRCVKQARGRRGRRP